MESYPEHDDIVRILESYGEVIFSTEFRGIEKCVVRSIRYKPTVMGHSPYYSTSPQYHRTGIPYSRDNYAYMDADTGQDDTCAESAYHELFHAMLHMVEAIEEGRY